MEYKIDKESKATEGLVVVEFINDDGRIEETRDYKYIKIEDVYQQMYEYKCLNLHHYYIEDLSLNDYINYLCNEKNLLHININDLKMSFYTSNCFFCCNKRDNIDFKLAKLEQSNFVGSVFYNDVDFRFSNLNNTADFAHCIFNGESNFGKIVYTQEALFEGCTFNKKASFRNSEINKETYFSNSIFNGTADFDLVKFLDYASFTGTKFNKRCIFTEIKSKQMDFTETTFEGELDLSKSIFKDNVIFNFEKCNILKINNVKAYEDLVFTDYEKYPVINKLELTNASFKQSIHISWFKSKIRRAIENNDLSSRHKANHFVILKEKFRNQGLYKYEDEAYVAFKQNEAKANLEEEKNKLKESGSSLKNKLTKPFKLAYYHLKRFLHIILFDKMGGYGTKPANVFRTMIITLALFTTFYMFPIAGFYQKFSFSNTFNCIYFSLITFLTIGYGDIAPMNNITRLVAGVEGFLGLFLMAYFTVAFARKVLR